MSTEVGRLLQPTQDCSKPPGVSQAEWRKALEEEWEAVIPPPALAGGADEEWQSFNRAAERCALRARARFQHPPNRGTIYRPKGSQPQLMKVGSHVKFKQAEGTFRQRSLAKFVSRLTEAIKQQPRVDQKLLVALNRTWPEQIPHDVSWDNALATAQKLLATEKGRLRAQTISKWRRRILQNDRYVTQWLKQQVFVLPPALLAEATGPGEERAATNSPNNALEAMQ